MWDLIVSVPDHCLSFYFPSGFSHNTMKQSNLPQNNADNSISRIKSIFIYLAHCALRLFRSAKHR